MQNFHSFLSDKADPFNDEEGLKDLVQHINNLVHFWLKRNIEVTKPWYTFEMVVDSIKISSITDKIAKFTIKNPHTKLREYFEFWVNFLEELQEEIKIRIDVIFHDKDPMNIIHSWLPDIGSERIVEIANIYSKDVAYNVRDQEEYNCLQISYFWENGVLQTIKIPNIHKWEYIGTIDGIIYKLYIDRIKMVESIVGKNNLLNE